MARTIVIAHDRSAGGKRALDRAAEFADPETSYSIVSVTGPEPTPGGLMAQKEALAEAEALLAGRAGGLRLVEAKGDAADQILAEAREVDADLVVVGSRGQTGLAAALLGSVSTEVVQKAPCDVLVVR